MSGVPLWKKGEPGARPVSALHVLMSVPTTEFIKEVSPLLPHPCHIQDYDRSMLYPAQPGSEECSRGQARDEAVLCFPCSWVTGRSCLPAPVCTRTLQGYLAHETHHPSQGHHRGLQGYLAHKKQSYPRTLQ